MDLFTACSYGRLDRVKYLVESGADIEVRDNYGNTPLICASYRGHLDVVKYLVESGADIEVRDNYGNTPLICASYRGHLDVVKYLVERGADIEVRNNNGKNAFDVSKGKKEILEVLNFQYSGGCSTKSVE